MIWSTRKGIVAALSAGMMTIAATTFVMLNSAQANARQVPPPPTLATVAPTVAPTVGPYYALQCTTPGTNSYGLNPPLTLTPTYTMGDRTTAYRNCNAPAFPNIRSGYEHISFGFVDDCLLMVTATPTTSYQITWNTNQKSTFTGRRNPVLSGNTFVVTFTGTITSGLFAGRRARQIFKGDATEINACLAGTGVVPFTIADVTFTIY